ncbi:MAG: cation-translocating P-type ATPase C-terminal domain-containing protein, partial [Eubacterium sp.]|nr:cation-translocating P-type ATPase C-terminal domain-containing protein [Eubacterium sp.]
TVVTLAAYFIGMHLAQGTEEFVHQNGMTMAFLTLSMAEIFHSFNMRSRRESIFAMKNQNKYLLGAMVLSLILTTVVIYVPFLANMFDFAAISALEYFISMLLAISVIPIVEIVKLIQRALEKKKR